jgi:hypothetical protein
MESIDWGAVIQIAILVVLLVLAFTRYIFIRVLRGLLGGGTDELLDKWADRGLGTFLSVFIGYKDEKKKKGRKDD